VLAVFNACAGPLGRLLTQSVPDSVSAAIFLQRDSFVSRCRATGYVAPSLEVCCSYFPDGRLFARRSALLAVSSEA